MRLRAVFIAMVLAAAVSIRPYPADDLILREDIAQGNALLVYAVTCDEAQASPRWLPERAEPPLPLARAVAIARRWVRETVGYAGKTKVVSIELSPIESPDVRDRWFYSVGLVPSDAAQAPPAYLTTVVILLNGKVVVPQIRH